MSCFGEGTIGVSLFTLGLSLVMPPSSEPLTISSTPAVLFSTSHIPLLLSSFLPALFLSFSIRSHFLQRATRGVTQHALYVPAYMLAIAGIFWAIVGIKGHATPGGIGRLAEQGWLFTIGNELKREVHLGDAWNYWRLFDLTKVEWWAMKGVVVDMILLVVIGVLNLPIFASTLALSLDVPSFNMDRELLGHAASNFLAGIAGTVPNLIVSDLTFLPYNYNSHSCSRFSPIRSFSSEQVVGGWKYCLLHS
jgi:MFS superfamily sulfate permease-like transporter